MLKNVTVTLTVETAAWARRRAAEQNTSVSRLIGKMLENQMRLTDEYWRAYEDWKAIARPASGQSAKRRLTRDQLHERR